MTEAGRAPSARRLFFALWPDARLAILSSDLAEGPRALKARIDEIARGGADLVIGLRTLLDRGELDKIIERSEATAAPPRASDPPREAYVPRPGFGDDRAHHYDPPHRKRKKSFLEELFD